MSRSLCRCKTLCPTGALRDLQFNSLGSRRDGFEYGYSRDYRKLWFCGKRSFGDFANVAQAVIDQFVCAGEDKWGLLSGLVLLLPHGYEGQGPSTPVLASNASCNWPRGQIFQICQPSNAAQYFHLLRRQALRHWPQTVGRITPKSMLRHPDACSPIEDFTHQRFLRVIPDTKAWTQSAF